LDEGSTPLVPNEDDPAMTDVIAQAAGKGGGTYKTLSK
jgi:hypothetical protein